MAAEQSRNVWIAKDDSRLVSSCNKDIYHDILEDRRLKSDLKYVTRSRVVPKYHTNKQRSPSQIKDDVFNSDRVQHLIDKVCSEGYSQREEVLRQVRCIIDEMGHDFTMGPARSLAFIVIKILKQIFDRIYVNIEGMEKVCSLIPDYPILLMPTHRSYMDFILVSIVFFHYDLPLPVIAAAQDFMGMNFFGWLLRKCGAFYIRRTFRDDFLYWAIFTEYVQSQICNGDFPIEFFVEGTRSRTCKSYMPKFGMLSAGLEPFFKSQVPDILVIPISISYDRVLEESLYTYELLGVPKPKESTSGLFKARKILTENFGSIHVHIGDPVSIRQFSNGRVDRSRHSLCPRYIVSLTDEEQSLIRTLAHHMVLIHQRNMVISPWSLSAVVLMQRDDDLSVRALVHELDWLRRLVSNLGAHLDWPANMSTEAVIRHSLSLHSNLAFADDNDVITSFPVTPAVSAATVGADGGRRQGNECPVLQRAAHSIMLSLYRNQCIHVFVCPAIVAIAVTSCKDADWIALDSLYQQYVFLEKVLNFNFIFAPGCTFADFEHSLSTLTHIGVLVVQEGRGVNVPRSTNKTTTLLTRMFEPFLLSYWLMCRSLMSGHSQVAAKPQASTQKTIVRDMQALTSQLLKEGIIGHYETMSLEMAGNCLFSLCSMGAVGKEKRAGVTYMYPNISAVSVIAVQLAKYTDIPDLSTASIRQQSDKVMVNSKL